MASEGIGADFHIQSKNNVTTFGADLGLVMNPSAEFGVGVVRLEENNTDLAATGVGPYVTAYPLRQSTDIPISISVSTSYLFYFFSGEIFDAFKDAGVNVNANQWTIGGTVFHRVEATPKFDFIPEFELGYSRLKVTASGFGDVASESSSGTYVALAARMVFALAEQSRLALIPQIVFSDNDSVLRFAIAWVSPR